MLETHLVAHSQLVRPQRVLRMLFAARCRRILKDRSLTHCAFSARFTCPEFESDLDVLFGIFNSRDDNSRLISVDDRFDRLPVFRSLSRAVSRGCDLPLGPRVCRDHMPVKV